MTPYVIPLSHAVAALVFVVAAGLLSVGRAQHRYKALLLAACGLTAVWAASVVAAHFIQNEWAGVFTVALEQARSLSWMAVVAFVLFVAYRKRMDRTVAIVLGAVTALAVTYVVALAIYALVAPALPSVAVRMTFMARIVVAVGGLLLVENLFRNSGNEARWAVKYLCFGVGAIFIYDFFIYAEASLFDRIEPRIYGARGIVDALSAPFIILAAARSKSWPIDIHISRQIVFRSATLLAAGGYLVIMSMAGFSLKLMGGAWGTAIQATFLTAAGLLLAVVVSSGKVQARVKAFISRNFFSYKYDYRKEWLQFIAAVSDSPTDLKIPDRAVRALANIVESTGGSLWMPRDGDEYQAVASFNMGSVLPAIACDHPFIGELRARQGVIDIRRGEIDGRPADAKTPQWLKEHNRAWLVLPLIHAQTMVGFVVLAEPRAAVALSWEDFDLLKTAGRQAASYIAEAEAMQSLARARRFEEFNRQFAFVIHDIKNLAGQMNLMVKNAEHHGANPEFQKDMLRTIGHCASRMRTLLEEIKGRAAASAVASRFNIAERLHRLAETWRLQIPALRTDLPTSAIEIDGSPDQLDTVINHLLQNALDAAGDGGKIALEFHIEGVSRTNGGGAPQEESWAVVTVSDDGPGMDRAFIDTKLFQPLTSVKTSGFGIGAFQTRQLVRDMGGRLEVDSQPGHGTRMIVRLPMGAPGKVNEPQKRQPIFQNCA